jgi:MFS family permease
VLYYRPQVLPSLQMPRQVKQGNEVRPYLMCYIKLMPRNRTRIFFYVSVVMLITEMVSPPLGSYLMDYWNSYYAYAIGLPLEFFGFVVLVFIPETLKKQETTKLSDQSLSSEAATGPELPRASWIRRGVSHFNQHLVHDVLPLISRIPVLLALVALFVNRFSRSILKTLMQYLSARFDWQISQVCNFV